jgi:hypothetical protein
MDKLDLKETVPVDEALAIVVRRAGSTSPAPPPVVPGLVCKACGTLLADRSGKAATGTPEDDECPGSGPHVPLLVDLQTAIVDSDRKVVRAVHLE